MRPLFGPLLLHVEAFAIAVAACDRAFHEVEERKERVAYDPDGFALLANAAMVRLDVIDPGQWEVSVTADTSGGRTAAIEVSPRKVRVYGAGCPNCGARSPAHAPFCARKGQG